MAVNILDQVRSFLTAPKLDEALGALAHNPPTPPIRTSWVWDSHITESAGGGGKGKLPQSVSLSWDENEARGIESSMRSWQGLTPRERKEILLAIYLANPWVSACVDVIAKRICSGGISIEKVSEEAKDNQQHYDQLMELCLRVNDDWDFLQFARANITDELIFGENYAEIIWKGGIPFQLVKVDCITMSYRANRAGQITKFEQQLTSTSQVNPLDPKDIIRWWFSHPHSAIDPFSPIERIQDAVNLDKKMVNWMTTFFQKGARFPYWVEFPGQQDEAVRYIEYFRNNHTGEKNSHIPPVAYDGAKLHEFGSGSLDIDFPGGRDRNRTEILSAFHVPPAAVGIIESGNIGGGTGEDQEKSFQYNTCDPIKHQFLEKLNYRVVQQGFGIKDYRIGLHYADFRNDESLAKVQDVHIRNGSFTINEARQSMGKPPYKDGGDVGIVVASKDVFPVPRITDMEDEQKQSAQLDIEAKQVANEKAKNPPEPTMLPGQQGANNAKNTQGASAQNKPAQKGKGNAKNQESEATIHNSLEARLSSTDSQHDLDSMDAISGTETPDAPVQESARDSQGGMPDVSNHSRRGNEAVHPSIEEQHAQATQSPSHQQSHARLTLLKETPDAQESEREADTNGQATSSSRGMASDNHTRQEGTIPSSSIESDTDGTTQGNTSTVEGDTHFTGMMLAFMLDPETAKQLAIPDGEAVDNLHITLAYLGDMEEEPEDDLLRAHTSPEKIRQVIAAYTSDEAKPLSGTVGGVGRFFPAETEETPVIALVDVPGLVEFRTRLISRIMACGYFVANNHGYTPHITLSYIDASAPMPIETVPSLPLTLDTVMLCVGDERIPFKLGGEPQQQQESANEQSDRDKLASALAAIFLAVQSGEFTTDEQNWMVDLLAKAYLVARVGAYKAAFQAIGSDALATWDWAAIKQWAQEQVGSIASTFEEMFKNANPATPEEAKQWIENLVSWKPEQIANVTLGSGADAGTRQAVNDMLEELTSDEIDTSLIPGGLSAESIRLRVVPDSSSSDFCSEYAGKTYALDEEGDIPVWPAHPGCIHSLEVYVVVGGQDEPTE